MIKLLFSIWKIYSVYISKGVMIMTEYKKIAILGAGAVGAYILWGLSMKDDIEVCLVADNDRKIRLEKDGLIINDKKY